MISIGQFLRSNHKYDLHHTGQARPNHVSNLVSRGHGVDIVPVFIEHGPPEFPCPTQNKQLNENNPLRVVGPPTTCVHISPILHYFQHVSLKKHRQPDNENRDSPRLSAWLLLLLTDDTAMAVMSQRMPSLHCQRKHRHNPAKIAPFFTTTDTNRVILVYWHENTLLSGCLTNLGKATVPDVNGVVSYSGSLLQEHVIVRWDRGRQKLLRWHSQEKMRLQSRKLYTCLSPSEARGEVYAGSQSEQLPPQAAPGL